MRKLVNGKKCTQMILIVIITMLIFNFIIPNYSQADAGGVLLKPITDLFSLLGDAICGALQMFLVDGEFFPTDGSILSGFLESSDGFKDKAADYDMEYDDSSGEVEVHKFYTDQIDLEGWDWWPGNDSVAIPVAKYTPDSIFAGLIPALDINFINPKVWEETEENDRSVTQQLHKTIATWYVALRNLAVVGLMVILVYVGIRMILSSTASDKAKYKQMMMDWLVAMCILFCLHYIMSFTITITEEITKAINGATGSVNTIPVVVYEGDNTSTTELVKFNTNLTGLARFQTKMDDGGTRLIYTIIYMALVIYTCMFTFTYLKRVITMAFLTLIAPLVALTYPIDKMNDGKAQAFNSWLKEYIFNALLQPFHLIIYTVLVASAMNLAATNPIYAIVALAFITPAEKILRKFFGFEKASTAGTLGAFANMAGGAAAYKMLSNAVNRRSKGGKAGSSGNIRTKNNKQLEDPNAPSGVDGFTSHNDGMPQQQTQKTQTALSDSTNKQPEDENKTTLQKMAEAYDEGYGTEDWDPHEREALQREAYGNQQSAYDIEETKQRLREQGWSEEDIIDTFGTNEGANPQIEQPNTPEISTTSETPVRNIRSKVGAGFAGVGRAISDKASTTVGNKHWRRQLYKNAGKGAVHLAARGYATVALGAAGLAAGAAGDNLEDIITYGVGGATLGATVGGNILSRTTDKIGSSVANSAIVQGFAEGYTGQTRMERDVAKQEKELQADPAFMKQVNEDYADGTLKGKELKVATARAAKFVSNGVDPSKLGKTMKVEDSILKDLENSQMEEEQKQKLAREQATTAAKMAAKITNPESLVGKKGEDLQKRWAQQIQAKNKDLKPGEAQKNAEEMMKRVRKIKGI